MRRSVAVYGRLSARVLQHDAPPPAFDLVIRNGTIVDGSGAAPFVGDVAMRGDRIVAVAPRIAGRAPRTIDATRADGDAGVHQHAQLGQ